MKRFFIALPLTLVLLLAACGGDGPTPTPPVTPPTNPTPPEDSAPVINSFSASPSTISVGSSAVLSWSVTNSEIIRITPDPGQGDLSSKTSVTVTPPVTTTYILEAVSLNGLDATAITTVTVGNSSEPPTSGVPYYGRWIVTFTSDLGTSFIHELDIDQASTTDTLRGGRGKQRLCLDDEDSTPCDDDPPYARGTGFIGNLTLNDGSAPLTLAIFSDLSGESELKLLTVGDAQLGMDSQGRQTLNDTAIWYLSDDSQSRGTISAVNVGAPRTLSGVVPSLTLENLNRARAILSD